MNFLVFIFDILTGGYVKNILSKLGVHSSVLALFFQIVLFVMFLFAIKLLIYL